jgi:D-serine deaminase-like pyridoxal phosphate-dependent protein
MNYHFEQEGKVPSPALIYYEDQIRLNTAESIRIAGGAARMWPHVKTHKMAEMIAMQMEMGIRRFKCATVSEIEMVAGQGAEHILWAYPVIGPNVAQFLKLAKAYPNSTLYALEDDMGALQALSDAAQADGMRVNVLLDVNMGMNRTGMPLMQVEAAYTAAKDMPGVCLRGLHCYDGHIHDHEIGERQTHADPAAEEAYAIRDRLNACGEDCGIMIMGGTPTFPCHAGAKDVFLSPGTLFVSDSGYYKNFPDIDVTPAAAVLTRVISHPAEGLFTLDTGVKAVSADANPRGILYGMEHMCTPVLSSEEHWVFEMKPEYAHQRPAIGDILYVIPTHICPTTAMYDAAYVVSGGRLSAIWKVAARERIGAHTLEELL